MINNSKNTMMAGAPKEKTLFHFSGDGIHFPKAILAETIQEAEKLWHAGKVLISTPKASPEAIPTEQKVEDSKPTDIE